MAAAGFSSEGAGDSSAWRKDPDFSCRSNAASSSSSLWFLQAVDATIPSLLALDADKALDWITAVDPCTAGIACSDDRVTAIQNNPIAA
ncbi:hypothetical protein OPV22_017702 [Ensete ventricosum]|uniref:Leucine-rich repeat-containing N-terminal plant-type domain-containing protein n=1 Tax=Ensete ventricosum TaxID=4639 RepID=A0AAV8R1K9_ENSVE|nr:hypothetical protein OPV22_017702 [Ensete ventricosum]